MSALPPAATPLKFALIFLGAFVTTVLCFYLMFLLIAGELNPDSMIDAKPQVTPTVATREPEERQPVRQKPKKIMPLEPPPEPEGNTVAQSIQPQLRAERPEFGNLADTIGPADIQLELTAPHSDLSPLVVVQPIYPLSAAMREIEGYVVVEFTVKENGTVLNPIVVESDPGILFNEAALSAVSRFRFSPRLVGGEAVRVDGVQMKFSFTLESLYGVEGARQ